MITRDIVEIDEEKCDGCGDCVIACAEGALEIRDGKARIIREIYCDGLGACIGECPQGALTIVSREADAFDEEAMEEHLKTLRGEQTEETVTGIQTACPGAKLVHFQQPSSEMEPDPKDTPASALSNWPVQLHLLSETAPFFKESDLLIAADCVPFAMGGFHQRLLRGKILAVGCPKLDDTAAYVSKLSSIFAKNDVRSVTIGYMEVPCCAGLVHVVHKALEASGKAIPVTTVKVGVRGEINEEEERGASRVKGQS
ncbi:MAG: 4Fe-4S binding protein [Deltaproteobacteria bacterium]|nr:MAG: 4Fe-4S binding protein [Deltaproteobacteria bacterium]